jgi:hypothetical protein
VQLPAFAGFLLGSFFEFEDVDDVPPKSRAVLELRGVSTLKTVLFIFAAVRTSNPNVYGFHMYVDRWHCVRINTKKFSVNLDGRWQLNVTTVSRDPVCYEFINLKVKCISSLLVYSVAVTLSVEPDNVVRIATGYSLDD